MLQAVCEHCNNYFVRSRTEGTFTIADGMISPAPDLLDGQRILIDGSALNDGVYTWHGTYIANDDDDAGAGLSDESFTGAVCGLAVPPQVAALAAEISEWVEKYGSIVNSPYQSESFAGYSYTKATGGSRGAQGAGRCGWEQVFASRLKRWKKVAIL